MTLQDAKEIIEALKFERAKAVKLAELATKSMYEHKKEIARLKAKIKELDA